MLPLALSGKPSGRRSSPVKLGSSKFDIVIGIGSDTIIIGVGVTAIIGVIGTD